MNYYKKMRNKKIILEKHIFPFIPSCIIILDNWEFIIDFTESVTEIFPDIRKGEKVSKFLLNQLGENEISFPDGRVYHQSITSILEHGQESGRIVWLTNITKFKKLIHDINIQNKYLEEINEEMKQANDKLKKANIRKAELLRIKERVKIAHEIHDSVGHLMTTINILSRVSLIQFDKDKSSALEYMKKCEELLESAIIDMKSNSFLFTNDFISLKSALNKLAMKTIPLNIHMNIQEEKFALPPNIVMSVYRICQEAITNTLRYSGAKNIYIDISFSESEMKLLIFDDGKINNIEEGFGMLGMRKRVEENGGEIEFKKSESGSLLIEAHIKIKF